MLWYDDSDDEEDEDGGGGVGDGDDDGRDDDDDDNHSESFRILFLMLNCLGSVDESGNDHDNYTLNDHPDNDNEDRVEWYSPSHCFAPSPTNPGAHWQ